MQEKGVPFVDLRSPAEKSEKGKEFFLSIDRRRTLIIGLKYSRNSEGTRIGFGRVAKAL